MSNYKNIFEKIDNSSDITQITNNITQLNLEDNNLHYLSEIVKGICNLYNEERLKGKNTRSILETLEQFLIKKKQNPVNIIDFCLVDQTNPTIQFVLASCYHYGKWVEKDEHKAFIYYQKSAEMADVKGTYNVGDCYRNGIGVVKDEHKAFIYYLKSAEMGLASGTYKVGYCYLHGIGVEKDKHKAFIYFQKSAEMGLASGMLKVAECYRNGIGITRDSHKAKYWYQREKDLTSAANKYDWQHNLEIDDNLKKILTENKYQLLWIPYDDFKNINEIGKGGFATVYYARWNDKSQNLYRPVALKLLHDSNNYHEEFINELKAYCDIGLKDPTFLKCFGISKDKASGNYILVMKYASKGSLRKNLHIISKMDWKDKLNLLQSIATDLRIIHSHDLIHRDLHSGNILQSDLKSAYIADLGFSMAANIATKSDEIFGILPYIAPEVLINQRYTKASDIYSFGIIMWEILYGKAVSYNQKLAMSQLCFLLCYHDLKPAVNKDAPQCYVNLMKKCWDKNFEKRSSAKDLCEIFEKWQNDENVLLGLNESNSILVNIQDSYYEKMFNCGSKFINSREITEKFSEMALLSKGIELFDIPDDF